MRQTINCKSYSTARRAYPSALIIVKVYGGFMIFYDARDYQIWKNQK